MKVLLIHNYYRFQGGEDRLVDIMHKHLMSFGHQVLTYFTYSNQINKKGIIYTLSLPLQMIYSSKDNNTLSKIIRKDSPKLAIIFNMDPVISLSILKILKKKNIPVIKRLENYKFLCLNGLFLRNDNKVCELCKNGNYLWGIRYKCYQNSFIKSSGMAFTQWTHKKRKTITKGTKLFWTPSRFVKNKFINAGFHKDKIKVIPNFLNKEPEPIFIPTGNYGIFLGRLSPEKGLLTLLKALRTLPVLSFKILGDGPMKEKLQQYISENNLSNVELCGHVEKEKKEKLLGNAIFQVFPTLCYESFGNSVLEGIFLGVPAIVPEDSALAELVEDGESGLYFKRGNSNNLKEKMKQMLNNPEKLKNMRHKSYKYAKKFYNQEKTLNTIKKMISQICVS